MNNNFLESLPQEEKEIIEDLYQQVLDNEISKQDFFNKVRELIGSQNLLHLFNKSQETQIKTDHLQDIIQYAGVDLKEEQENITRDAEIYREMAYDSVNYDLEDYNSTAESLLNVQLFVEFINRIILARGMKINDEAYQTTFMVLKRKICDFIDKLVEASKIRVDASRNEFNLLVENDIRRQLWVLEQNEQREMEKLKFKRDDDEHKKKIKKTVQEREDLLIKKRMSNTVALAALGSKQKSWMSFGEESIKENETPFHSLYSPFDEKEQDRKVFDRVINMQDFLYVLEHDKRYNKSIITIQQYFYGK
ncbi:hypothetical protein GVAV_000584 [Gurleya vavrai]